MTTYTALSRLPQMQPGDLSVRNAWGGIINAALVCIEQLAAGNNAIDLTGLSTYTLTVASNAPDQARQQLLPFIGTLSAPCSVTIPTVARVGFAANNTTGSQNIVLTTGNGASMTLGPGSTLMYTCDGANVAPLTLGTSQVLNADPGVSIGNASAYNAKTSAGTLQPLLSLGSDNWTDNYIGPSGWRVVSLTNQPFAALTPTGQWTFNNSVIVNGPLTTTGSATIQGTATLQGAAVLSSTLDVTGASRLRTTVQIDGVTTLSAGFTSSAASTCTNTLTVNGNFQATGGSTLNGAQVINGSLQVNQSRAHFSGGTTTQGFSGQIMQGSGGVVPYTGSVTANVVCDNGIQATTVYAGSDSVLKENIRAITPKEGRDNTMKLRPSEWTLIEGGEPDAGFVAQDLIAAGMQRRVKCGYKPGIKAHDGLEDDHIFIVNSASSVADNTAALQYLIPLVERLAKENAELKSRLDAAR